MTSCVMTMNKNKPTLLKYVVHSRLKKKQFNSFFFRMSVNVFENASDDVQEMLRVMLPLGGSVIEQNLAVAIGKKFTIDSVCHSSGDELKALITNTTKELYSAGLLNFFTEKKGVQMISKWCAYLIEEMHLDNMLKSLRQIGEQFGERYSSESGVLFDDIPLQDGSEREQEEKKEEERQHNAEDSRSRRTCKQPDRFKPGK